jgi:dolichol-phosphate mannosyltransferase
MNYRLWKAGARIKEIPIVFVDRRSGVSKMSRNIVYEAAFLVWKLQLMWIFGRLKTKSQ